MIICESEFEDPDPRNPKYSMTEVDYYAWIPIDKQREYNVPNHRLSLRKNLETGEYEVYRHYYQTEVFIGNTVLIEKEGRTLGEEVIFKSKSLEEAIKFADEEWRKFHGEGKEPDKVCQHKYPIKSPLCKY